MTERLIITGNGFDLAHGLKTSYKDFYEQIPIEVKSSWEELLCNFKIDTDNWYSFEELIDKLSLEWYFKYFIDSVENDKKKEEILNKQIQKINLLFLEMTSCLYNYLDNIDELSIIENENIKNAIQPSDFVISFNYTKFAQNYSDNVYYIHGSLDEKHIVLGYKQREANPTGILAEATVFDKKKLREQLNFRRYLIGIGLSEKAIETEIAEFNSHVSCMFSGRGGYLFDYSPSLNEEFINYNTKRYEEKSWSTFNRFRKADPIIYPCLLDEQLRNERLQQISKIINDYGEINNFLPAPICMNIDFTNVKELIILGHSLEADEELIVDIINELDNLEKIKLFVYSGEDYSNKISFLNNVSDRNVEIVYY